MTKCLLKGKNMGSFSLLRLCEQCQASYVTRKPTEGEVWSKTPRGMTLTLGII